MLQPATRHLLPSAVPRPPSTVRLSFSIGGAIDHSTYTHQLTAIYGTNNPMPVMAPAWYSAPRRLSGTGGVIHGAQLPGR